MIRTSRLVIGVDTESFPIEIFINPKSCDEVHVDLPIGSRYWDMNPKTDRNTGIFYGVYPCFCLIIYKHLRYAGHISNI